VRIARAATQRKKIVLFEESYHGLSDTVLAARDSAGRSYSVVPGVLQEFADQIIVLEYGNMRHLDAIGERAGEIACVLVEPVQSRHPYRKPVEFLHEVRKLTLEKDIVLIFDEMIRGRRAISASRPTSPPTGKSPAGACPPASWRAWPGIWTWWTAGRGISAMGPCPRPGAPR
jgi:glutamate-1-semialdehyde aminotransferase